MGKTAKMSLIVNKNSIVLLNNNGNELARIPSTGPACLAGSRLFLAMGNKIQVIDLETFSPKLCVLLLSGDKKAG
jgi:hypothetical protein